MYTKYGGNGYDKTYEFSSTLKNKKLKINIILNENYKEMVENPDFEQNHYSKTSTAVYRIGQDSVKLMKWICY